MNRPYTPKHHVKHRAARTLAALALAAAASVGAAHDRAYSMANVEAFDRTEGRVLPVFMHGGRRYVVGRPGNEYSIRIVNRRGERVLAVMSVDGVNVISGDTASTHQAGYVLSPYESADIAGWRKNMAHVAAFYFTALPDSYAARTGRPANVGVIGVALFGERVRAQPPVSAIPAPPLARRALPEPRDGVANADQAPFANSSAPSESRAMPRTDAPASPLASGAVANAQERGEPSLSTQSKAGAAFEPREPSRQKLGTGHGRIEDSAITYTSFERASSMPDETVSIYYDSYENLLAQGVPVGSPPIARARPQPFPDLGRFVPDPR